MDMDIRRISVSDNIENLTLRTLQEMRVEIASQLGETRAQIAVLAQSLVGLRNDVRELRTEVGEIKLHVQEIAIIVDHHSHRLERIEQHLDLESKH